MKTRMLLAIALTFSGFPACKTTGGPDVSGMCVPVDGMGHEYPVAEWRSALDKTRLREE